MVLAAAATQESPEDRSRSAMTAGSILIAICLTFGVYLPLFMGALCRLIRKPAKTYSHWIHIGVTALTGSMALMYVVSTVVYTMGMQEYPRHNDFYARRISSFFGSISGVGPIYLVCDGLVAWRAWALYPEHKKVNGALAIFGLVSLAVISTLFYAYAIPVAESPSTRYSALTERMLYLIFVPPVLSILINLVSTIAIFFKLSQIYSYAKERRMQSYKVLVILVETGLGYVIIQIASVTMFFMQAENLKISLVVSLSTMPIVAAIYPVLLINLITHQLSQPDRPPIDMTRTKDSNMRPGFEFKIQRFSSNGGSSSSDSTPRDSSAYSNVNVSRDVDGMHLARPMSGSTRVERDEEAGLGR